jgi:hypothetical protein
MDTPEFRTQKVILVSFMPDLKPGYNLIRMLLGGLRGYHASLRVEAIQSGQTEGWIASSLKLLAMTALTEGVNNV